MDEFKPVKKVEFVPVKKLNKESNIWESIAEEAPKVLGGIAGGLVGLPGGPAGVIGGVAAGAAAGEAYKQIGQQVSGDPEAPQTSMEAAKDIGIAGITEAAFESLGQVAPRIIGKIIAPFAKKLSKEAVGTINYLKDKIKPVLTPAEATESRILDVLENISEASIFGGGHISTFKLKRQKIMESLADDIIDNFGKRVEPDEIGDLFVKTIEGKNDAFRASANILYNNVEELAEGAVVSLDKIKKFAAPLTELGEEVSGIESKNAGDDLMSAIGELSDTLDFATAKELRTRLMSRINEFSIINKKAPAIGKARKAVELLDDAISEGLKTHNADAYDAWREANKYYKEGQKDFNNTFIRRLIKKGDPELGGDPEAIAKAIFKPGAISNIRRTKLAVDNQTWEQLQSYYIQRLFSQSADMEGKIVGTKLMGVMFGKTGMGSKTLNEIFTPSQFREISKFVTALKMTQSKQSEGLGKMWIQLTQAGATATVFGMGSTPAAGAILLGPPIISRLLLNPKMARLLTTGLKLPANSPQVAGITSRLLNAASNIKKGKVESDTEDIRTEFKPVKKSQGMTLKEARKIVG